MEIASNDDSLVVRFGIEASVKRAEQAKLKS